MRRRLVAIFGCCLLAVPAQAAFKSRSLKADLDGDGAKETVKTVRASHDRNTVHVLDNCTVEGKIDRKIAGPQALLAHLSAIPVDPLPGKEVFADLRRSNNTLGEVVIAAWRATDSAGECGEPRALFRYTRFTSRPAGATSPIGFSVSVQEKRSSSPGTEIVLTEFFRRKGGGGSVTKRSYYRYSANRDRYVKYSTKTS